MKKQKQSQFFILALLALVVISTTIGFAALTQNLDVNGTATVQKSKWSVHFDQNSYKASDGSQPIATQTISGTNVQFSSTLSKPGDYCSFSIKAVNDGTFDAVLNQINMSELATEQSKYLAYTVNYGGNTYTSTNTELNTALNVGASSDVVVRVEYVTPADSADLPSSDMNINLRLQLVYSQK